MPTFHTAADSFDERLRAVETSIDTHRAECNIRNERREKWEEEIHRDVDSLKMDRAKALGIAIAASTLSSAIGAGGMLALFRAIGK